MTRPALLGLALWMTACADSPAGEPDAIPAPFDPGVPYEPVVSAGDLSADIRNPLLPAPVGRAKMAPCRA